MSHSLPYPPTNGGNQRTSLMLRALQELGDVDLLLLHGQREPEPDVLQHLKARYTVHACMPMPRRAERGIWRRFRWLHPKTVDRLAHHLGRDAMHYEVHQRVAEELERALETHTYDLIIGRYLKPTSISGALRYAPLILDIDDLDYEVWRTRLEDPATPVFARPIIRHHLRQLEQVIPPLLAQCDRLWVSNELDLLELNAFPVSLLPNIPYCPTDQHETRALPPNPGSLEILTVASFLQPRNIEGIHYFVTRIWPLVRHHIPEASFRIVGSHMTPDLREQWAAVPGVEPVGFVEDLSEAYASCAFTVAPLFYGGGTNIKVLESLAYGRTCVVTPFVHRGFQRTLPHGQALYCAEGAQGLADACVELLNYPDRTCSLARRGAELVAQHYSFEHFRNVIHTTVQAVLHERQGMHSANEVM